MLPHLAHSFFGISEARGGFTSHGDAEKEEKKTSRRAQGPGRLRAVLFSTSFCWSKHLTWTNPGSRED